MGPGNPDRPSMRTANEHCRPLLLKSQRELFNSGKVGGGRRAVEFCFIWNLEENGSVLFARRG